MCVYVRRLAILAMDKKHLFHTFTVICPWYTNNSWGFSSMQNYQRVFGSVWRRRRSADVSNAPKAQKLQDNFTQELRPPAAIINLYSCKGTRQHTTLKFGRLRLMFLCFFLSKPPTLNKVKTLGRSLTWYDMVTDFFWVLLCTSQTCWNTEGKSWMSSGRTWPRTDIAGHRSPVGPSTSCWVDDISHRSSPSPSPWKILLYDDLGSPKNLYRKDVYRYAELLKNLICIHLPSGPQSGPIFPWLRVDLKGADLRFSNHGHMWKQEENISNWEGLHSLHIGNWKLLGLWLGKTGKPQFFDRSRKVTTEISRPVPRLMKAESSSRGPLVPFSVLNNGDDSHHFALSQLRIPVTSGTGRKKS